LVCVALTAGQFPSSLGEFGVVFRTLPFMCAQSDRTGGFLLPQNWRAPELMTWSGWTGQAKSLSSGVDCKRACSRRRLKPRFGILPRD
jgi:hypothetical protein